MPPEIDIFDARTICEGPEPNVGDGTGDGDTGELRTAPESQISDYGNPLRQGDVGQGMAVAERIFLNGCSTAGPGDSGETAAFHKGIVPDVGDAVSKLDVSQFVAGAKGAVSDVLDAVGNRDATQTATLGERSVPDMDKAVWKVDAGQVLAVHEGTVADTGDVCSDPNTRQSGARIKRVIVDLRDAVRNRKACDVKTGPKGRVANAGDAFGNRVTSRPAIRILDKRGSALIEEYPVHTAIAGVLLAHVERLDVQAVSERLYPDIGYAGPDHDGIQAAGVGERGSADAGDAVANDDFRQATGVKSFWPNACNRQTTECAGDGNYCVGPSVSDDGHRRLALCGNAVCHDHVVLRFYHFLWCKRGVYGQATRKKEREHGRKQAKNKG